MSDERKCAHEECGRALPDWRPKAQYCNAQCKAKARYARLGSGHVREKVIDKRKYEAMFGTDDDFKTPAEAPETPQDELEELDEGESPYAAQIAQMEAARDDDMDEFRADPANQPKKRGRKSWQEKTQMYHRNVFAIPGLKDGRHPADPTGYYTFAAKRNVEQNLSNRYRFASRKRLGLEAIGNISGLSRGVHPDQIWVNEMVLMRRPLQDKLDEDRYHQLLTDAQTVDLEKAAERMGLVDARPKDGWFGKGDIVNAAARRKRARDED